MSALTIQQARAMTSFLWSGLRGFSDDACDGDVWDRGVRPWPTMRNLEAKGLVTSEWFSPDDGYTYHLTGAGREYMASVVAERSAAPAPEGDDAAKGGSYQVPRACVCGEEHLDRDTYWKHRLLVESATPPAPDSIEPAPPCDCDNEPYHLPTCATVRGWPAPEGETE